MTRNCVDPRSVRCQYSEMRCSDIIVTFVKKVTMSPVLPPNLAKVCCVLRGSGGTQQPPEPKLHHSKHHTSLSFLLSPTTPLRP